ncbi:hypothetical protein NB311A_08343 [Nitrobacter sp. Nb-311A]|nr:hypothetical protein NB311A_08343 [Nitrobacter sp. Nb-311A]
MSWLTRVVDSANYSVFERGSRPVANRIDDIGNTRLP